MASVLNRLPPKYKNTKTVEPGLSWPQVPRRPRPQRRPLSAVLSPPPRALPAPGCGAAAAVARPLSFVRCLGAHFLVRGHDPRFRVTYSFITDLPDAWRVREAGRQGPGRSAAGTLGGGGGGPTTLAQPMGRHCAESREGPAIPSRLPRALSGPPPAGAE